MPRFALKRFMPVIATIIPMLTCDATAQMPRLAGKPFALSATWDASQGLVLHWRIHPGDYLYRDKIEAVGPAGNAIAVATSPGEVKEDPTLGQVEIYRQAATARIDHRHASAQSRITIKYQGCADSGICYPPVSEVLDLAKLQLTAAVPGEVTAAPSPDQAPELASPSTDAGISPSSSMQGSLAIVFLAFAGFGLLLAFTPCMFPMIPILSGLLARSGTEMTLVRGMTLSAVYVLAMASAYAVLGAVAAWSGYNLQIALQSPWALGAMTAIFTLLALSMLGVFELKLPSAWVNFVARRTATQGGSVSGAALLGFGSALIVGPCVTPPLSAALLYATQTGDAGRSAMALFALGLGMGLPLLAFGAFGSSVLPRSGPWLAAVNAMFGAIFLGLAISMLARIVPPPFSLAAWGIFAIGLGVFLGAFEQDALPSLARRIERTIGIAAAVYGIALVVGFASGASDPLRPLAAIATARPEHLEAPMPLRKVVNAQQLDRAIAEARAEHRPVLIGFSADWCSECKTIERYVLTDPRVLAQLRHVALIHIDVTRADAESYALMRRFQVAGPPTYLVLDAQNGGEGGGPDWRQVGDMTTGDLLRLVAHAKST